MDYWESVLKEIKHKEDDNFSFKFTDMGRSLLRDRHRKQRQGSHELEKRESTSYFLGGAFAGVYFTKREAQTLFHLLQGKTIPQVGKSLNLSARTIEFYVKNMKLKVGAVSKVELLDKIRCTDIVKQLNFDVMQD